MVLMVLRLLTNTFLSRKSESVHFYLCPQAKLSPKFLSLPPDRRKLPIPPEQHFLKIYFFPAEMGGEDGYGVEKMTKIKPASVLVANFDKLRHLCNFYFFGFCFVLP